MAILYPLNYWVGASLLGSSRAFKWPEQMDVTAIVGLMKQSPMVLMNLFVGGLVLGLPLAVGGYFFTLRAVRLYRSKRETSHRKRLNDGLKSLNRP